MVEPKAKTEKSDLKLVSKYKKTNGIAPLFKVRKNYRQFLKEKEKNDKLINAFVIF